MGRMDSGEELQGGAMIKSMHYGRAVERQIEALQRSGRKGEKAVAQYHLICDKLRQPRPEGGELLAKRTKNGELRVKNCVKYHLGHGYRLITIRIEDRLYLPFLGTHDEVDQWLDARRREGFEPVESCYRREWLAIASQAAPPAATEVDTESPGDDPYERQLAKRLDDAVLTVVFSGLRQRQEACGTTAAGNFR